MKVALFLVLLVLFECSLGDVTQKNIIDLLTHYGDELLQSTDKFLHEQRRHGHENLLHDLEKNIVDLELLLIELRNFTLHVEDEKSLKQIHEIEHKLFAVEDLIAEEILSIKNNTGHSLTTPNPLDPTTHGTTLKPDPIVTEAQFAIAKAEHFLQTYHGSEQQPIENRIKMIRNYLKVLKDPNLHPSMVESVQHKIKEHYDSLNELLKALENPNEKFVCTQFGLFRDVLNPRIYHHCWLNGKHLTSSDYLCPVGESYTSEHCHAVHESESSWSTTTIPTATPTPKPVTHRPFVCTSNGLFKDPEHTRLYHQCLFEEGHFRDYVHECPLGQHFDQSLLHCIAVN